MGRRKIEIKAIKDDRNRSVTFLKRKGGLFKKAHELSVLCSVDVAVIIFGNNKKLYEYSSSDIGEILSRYNYYGGAAEHKGPNDFSGKMGKDMDDDDDDDGSGMSTHGDTPQMLPPQFQNQPPFQHIRHQTPSASPPVQNGVYHPQQRTHTPQPISRPGSSNANLPPRRQSSNLAPQQNPHPQPTNGYPYMQNHAGYNLQQPGMPPHQHPQHPHPQHHGIPPHMQTPQMQTAQMQAPQNVAQQGPPQPPQYPNYGPPPQAQHHQQVQQQQHAQQQAQQQQTQQQQQHQAQQMYAQEQQRRASVPPVFKQERSQSRQDSTSTPPQHQQAPVEDFKSPPEQTTVSQPAQQQPEQPAPHPEPVKRLSVKSKSIFTPIDESRSILSQHWASSSSSADPKNDPTNSATSTHRSQSVDVGAVSRDLNVHKSPPPVRAQTQKNRNTSMSSIPEGFHPPSRTNSASMGGGKRPVLKVQIPDEPSDAGSPAVDELSSPRSGTNATSSRRTGQTHENSGSSSGVLLPPPSPSASALLSAGASGPPNPFARPHPPVSGPSQGSNNNSMIDTPVSALPSRFMNNEFLPSPSSFYPDWNFNGRDSNTLPSPLNFATPVVGSGPSFLHEDMAERANGNGLKRKTPEPEGSGSDEGGSKRPKHD